MSSPSNNDSKNSTEEDKSEIYSGPLDPFQRLQASYLWTGSEAALKFILSPVYKLFTMSWRYNNPHGCYTDDEVRAYNEARRIKQEEEEEAKKKKEAGEGKEEGKQGDGAKK